MPNDDYIKRSDAIKAFEDAVPDVIDFFGENMGYSCPNVEKIVGSIPAADVEPNQRWIPVTEDTPHDNDFYYITVRDEHGVSPCVCTAVGWYCEEAKTWVTNGIMRDDVIAWMPHPEPYTPPKEKDDAE